MKKLLVAMVVAGIGAEVLNRRWEAGYRASSERPMSEIISPWCGNACRNPSFCLN